MFRIEKDDEDVLGKKWMVLITILAIPVFLAVVIFTPVIMVWANLWLLDNALYEYTSLGPVPSWAVYIVTMVMILVLQLGLQMRNKDED